MGKRPAAKQWIAWAKGLTRRREIVVIGSKLGISRREAAACCMEIWEWCDDEGEFDLSRNCHVRGVTIATGLSLIDSQIGIEGFGEAMREVITFCVNRAY